MPTRTTKPTAEDIRARRISSIAIIFDQAQISYANHTKNYVELYKVQAELAEYTEDRRGKTVAVGEQNFRDEIKMVLTRLLTVKKGVPSADRIAKFIGGYLKFMHEKDVKPADDDDSDDDQSTTASRFTVIMIKFLLKAFPAKDKTVRYRAVHILSEMIQHLGAIDETRYDSLRASFVDRINDKEPSVRHYAAICLARLWKYEDPEKMEEGESILEILMDSMAYDPSSEVRRAVVANIPINARTLTDVLNRMRDTDAMIRKSVYATVLNKNVVEGEEEGEKVMGPTHPRALTVAQRELIVKSGLGDRDPSVKAAAASLLVKWVEVVDIKLEEDVKQEYCGGEELEKEVLSLLELFDLVEGKEAAVNALLSIFTSRVDIFNSVQLDEQYWTTLTPEKAFFARVFVEHCKNTKDEVRLENTLPVVTFIALSIEHAYKHMAGVLDVANSDGREDEEVVISELLKLAVYLDYSDEIGRRSVFRDVRNMLGDEALPEALIEPCLDVLRELSNGERDLIRLVVEIIQELRDGINGTEEEISDSDNDPSLEATQANPKPSTSRKLAEDKSAKQIVRINRMDSRCLAMCIGMLKRVNGTFEENITLDGILKGLIIPSISTGDEALREKACQALGLCCLIARKLAVRFVSFFVGNIPGSTLGIKSILIQSLFDIFMAHENALFKDHVNNLEATTKFLLKQIVEEQDPKVKAIVCMGTAKLVLSGMITDIDAIKTLLKAYLSPLTLGNQELRQCLAFFFSMYSHSSSTNQETMREIFILMFLDICEDRKAATDEDEGTELISSVQIANMFVDWTDPLRLAMAINARGPQNAGVENMCIQLDMAEDILKLLFEKDLKVEIEKGDKRVLCQLLNKLYVPDLVDDYRIRSLKLLMVNLRTRHPFRDSVCKNAFLKFENMITKKFQKQLEHFSEEEFRKFEELNELFEFLDSIIPLDDDEDEEVVDAPKRGRKRRSESIISVLSESHSASPPVRKDKGKPKAKRPRLSTTSNEGEDEEGSMSPGRSTPGPAEPPRRTRPKRAAATIAARKNIEVILISSDSEEYTENPGPKRKGKTQTYFRPSVKEEEAQVNQDLDDLLANNSSDLSEVPYDSIMDPDSEEEEEEVTELLAEE